MAPSFPRGYERPPYLPLRHDSGGGFLRLVAGRLRGRHRQLLTYALGALLDHLHSSELVSLAIFSAGGGVTGSGVRGRQTGQTLEGSFSVMSKPMFARKASFESA